MADSEDEYDRKRRDKFRGERGAAAASGSLGGSGGGERRDARERDRERERERDGRHRDEWAERSGRRRGYSPPPPKRSRLEWERERERERDRERERERERYGYAHDGYGSYGWAHDAYGPHPAHQAHPLPHPHPPPPHHAYGPPPPPPHSSSPSAVVSFKVFLQDQDDSITDEEAIRKYNEYKADFRRQQLNEFFVAHKDEEWFRCKYHPEESARRREEQRNSLRARLRAFVDLSDAGRLEGASVDADRAEELTRLLDAVVIKLEGGTDDDLKVLDEGPEPAAPNPPADAPEPDGAGASETPTEVTDAASEAPTEAEECARGPGPDADAGPAAEDAPAPVPAGDAPAEADVPRSVAKRKRSGESSGSSGSSSSSSSSSSDSSDSEAEESSKREAEAPHPPEENGRERPETRLNGESAEVDGERKTKDGDADADAAASEERRPTKKPAEPAVKERREMHKTTSIFLRNLAPTITKAEVEAMCRRYGGFLRVALADPLPDRRWFRRGWVSFRRDVNIKDVCWNLNNIRLKDCELGAIVNRDLSRRIRPVNGITLHRQVVRADARLAARLCYRLDARAGLWDTEAADAESDAFHRFDLRSSNPVLHNITDYLIEEAPAEEEELLGLNSSESGEVRESESTIAEIERDPQLTAVLDRLVLYLRIVHSVDYYNHCEYPYEDEMPNRCGIMHARGPPPSSKPTPNDISEYVRTFQGKMSSFLQENRTTDEEELGKLGAKDPQAEVEKFIQANTQELAKDKWLCPLSGKKFKGPDFIRKHIFNKHAEKVEEVKKEVEYFNNYLRDPKRPQSQEPAASAKRPEPSPSSYASRNYGYPAYNYAPPVYPPAVSYGSSRHGRPFNRGRGPPSDFRPVIHYRDLDAPREPEDFI